MRIAPAVLIVIVVALPALSRSQSDTDTDTEPTISIHPAAPTILLLPDEIVHAWIEHAGEIRVARFGRELIIRPRPGTRAGVEASLEVETRTMHRIFRLRVVRRVRDAQLEIVVAPPALPPVALLRPPVLFQEPAAPPVSLSMRGPGPALAPAPKPAEPTATGEPPNTHDASAVNAPRFEVSWHALGALGTTELTLPGYRAQQARQSHRVLGMRVGIRRPGNWWSVEANVSGEWPATPTVHKRNEDDKLFSVSGPSLRLDVGMRARLPTRLSPTLSVGFGLQAHHRDIESNMGLDDGPSYTPRGALPLGGVLALGLGLEYRAGDLSLGLEVQVRKGVPDDYHSVAALLSVGIFLDQENEP